MRQAARSNNHILSSVEGVFRGLQRFKGRANGIRSILFVDPVYRGEGGFIA